MKFSEADRIALEWTYPSDRWWRESFPFGLYYWLKVLLIFAIGNIVQRIKRK